MSGSGLPRPRHRQTVEITSSKTRMLRGKSTETQTCGSVRENRSANRDKVDCGGQRVRRERDLLRESVVEAATRKELQHADPSDVMKMRVAITWKTDENGEAGKRAECRLVILGFQDPFL